MMNLNVVILGICICFPHRSDAVKGCITIKINDKGKECICSKLTTKFSKIPADLPDFVVKLEVKNQNIHSLTSEQLSKLSWMVELNLDTNKLSSVDPDAFINVQKLQILSLRNNFLILGGNSFPSAALTHLKNLRIINLENNPLGFVPDYFFQPLKALQKLTLSRAPSGFYIESNGLVGLSSLEMLDISFSHISALDKNIESSLKYMQLQELYIYGNPWKCDCNMKWLLKWYLKFKDVKLLKQFTRANGERGTAQPQCNSPPKFKGRNIFEISTGYDFVKPNEMNCPPRIFTQNQQVQVDRGKNLTLTCEFQADPGGKVNWSKNGMIVLNHWQRIRWSRTVGVRFTSTLTITKAELVDNGLWRCILVTDIDRANATFTVRVRHSYQVPLDLSIILKYIGIGAVTLILLLVIIGIAIYCIYGFKIRPFVKHTKTATDSGRNIRPTRLENDNRERNQDLNGFRPIMVDALVNRAKTDDVQHFLNRDESQKCLLLPTSPAMLLPISSNPQFPCPLHGNISFMNNHSFQDNKQHQVIDYSDSIGLIQPHTLPRQNHKSKIRTNPVYIETVGQQNENNAISCPLHGHILASIQTPGDEDPDNLNAIYSTFFSPRHSHPLVSSFTAGVNHDSNNNQMSSSVEEPTILVPINDIANNINFFCGPSNDPSTYFPNRDSRGINGANVKKAHDDEGYSTSV